MCPKFPGELRKNDGIFLYGSLQQKPFVFVYEQKVLEIVYGPSCDPEKEIYLDRCSADGVSVMKRRGGGGTVVLAPGMVVTIFVGERHTGDRALDYFNAIHDGMIALFHNCSVKTIVKKGISDLSIGGRK
jgi:lipoate-protein ligase A